MPTTQSTISSQQISMEHDPFRLDQENSIDQLLRKRNRDAEVGGTERAPIFERRRNDSLHSRNSSTCVETARPLGGHLGQPMLSAFATISHPLNANPNAMEIELGGGGNSSQTFTMDDFWAHGHASSVPLQADPAADHSIAHAEPSISRYGQYTPPEDGAQKFCSSKPEPYPPQIGSVLEQSGINVGDEPAEFLQDRESKFRPTSPQSRPRRRRRKSSKTVNLEEEHKREEFLARNRVAASKSRQKKKEWTTALEEQLKNLQAENTHLHFTVTCLRDEVISLKTLCLAHVNCDCSEIREYLNKSLTLGMLKGQNGHRLPTMSPTPVSLQGLTASDHDSDGLDRRSPEHSLSENFPSCTGSNVVDSSHVNSIVESSEAAHRDGRAASMGFASIDDPSYGSSSLSRSGSPSADTGDLGSPQAKMDLTDQRFEERDVDIDMSAIWDEAVGDGDYITGTAGQPV